MKKFFLAVTAVITFAGVMTIVACSKEETKIDNNTKNAASSFEYVGQMHNDILWNLGMAFQDDLNSIVEENGISESDAMALQLSMEEWGRQYCIEKYGGEYISYLQDWHIDVEQSVNDVMVDSMLNALLDKATSFDELFVLIENEEEAIASDLNSLSDTTKLMSLIILKHSLEFWSDAYLNEQNPWHKITFNYPYAPSTQTKGLPDLWDKFKSWVTDKAVPFIKDNIAELVTAAIDLVGMDYVGWQVSAGQSISFGTAFGCPACGVGMAVTLSAVSSAVGGIWGWTHPLF